MSIFETPTDFSPDRTILEHQIQFTNLTEIGQGAPLIGTLSIDGVGLDGYMFGGPPIFKGDKIYLPILIRKFVGSKFRISSIDLNDKRVQIFGGTYDFIFLNKIEDGEIFFYDNFQRTQLVREPLQ